MSEIWKIWIKIEYLDLNVNFAYLLRTYNAFDVSTPINLIIYDIAVFK